MFLQNNGYLDNLQLDKLSCPPQQKQGILFWVLEIESITLIGIPVRLVVAAVVEMFHAPNHNVVPRCYTVILPHEYFRRAYRPHGT